jgi:hypothetical protein
MAKRKGRKVLKKAKKPVVKIILPWPPGTVKVVVVRGPQR